MMSPPISLHHSRELIQQWIKDKKTIPYLAKWEQLHNPAFDLTGYYEYTKPKMPSFKGIYRWMKSTNAIGFKRTRGRYGKTVKDFRGSHRS